MNIQSPWGRIRKNAEIADVRLHDLRHTFASIAVGNGQSLPVIGVLLGHSSNETTARYAHLQHDYVWQANQKIGNAIESLLHADQVPTAEVAEGENALCKKS